MSDRDWEAELHEAGINCLDVELGGLLLDASLEVARLHRKLRADVEVFNDNYLALSERYRELEARLAQDTHRATEESG